MKGLNRSVFVLVLVFHLLSLALFLALTLITPSASIHPDFQFSWILGRVFSLWVEYYLPITISAFILAFSGLVNVQNYKSAFAGTGNFVTAIANSLKFLVLLTVGYVLILAFLDGPIRNSYQLAQSNSLRLVELIKSANENQKIGNSKQAKQDVQEAIRLSPENESLKKLRDTIVLSIKVPAISTSPATIPKSGLVGAGSSAQASVTTIEKAGMDLAALIQKSKQYVDQDDFYSALYFIELAERISPQKDIEVSMIRNLLETKLANQVSEKDDDYSKQLYRMKNKAILTDFPSGRFEEAYYTLLDVELFVKKNNIKGQRAGPLGDYLDMDVREWMPLVLEALNKQVFFSEELLGAIEGRSLNSLLVKNASNAELVEYLYAKAVVPGAYSWYLIQPEVITFDKAGKIVAHRVSERGKIIGSKLLMRSIDKQDPLNVSEVRILKGEFAPEIQNHVAIKYEGNTLYSLAESQGSWSIMTAAELISILDIVREADLDLRPVQRSLLMYLVKILSMVSLGIFGIAWAWSNRSRYLSRPLLPSLALLVLVPIMTIFMNAAYFGIMSIINMALLTGLGMVAAIVGIIIVQTLQTFVAFVYLAGRSA